MAEGTAAFIRSWPSQVLALALLIVGAVVVWTTRGSDSAVAIGDRSVSEIADELAEKLEGTYGEICAEHVVSTFFGTVGDTNLDRDSDIPVAVEGLVGDGERGLTDFGHQQIDTDRLVFVYEEPDRSEVAADGVVAAVVEVQYVYSDDAEDEPGYEGEWMTTERESLYPCDWGGSAEGVATE